MHKTRDLPDISDLLRKLNDARKAASYGDIELPKLDAEDTAAEIEEYVEAVAADCPFPPLILHARGLMSLIVT
jgi:hypothetical protein